MYKIKRVLFSNHPVLGDLELSFCDQNGKVVNTIILAGENGTGKSTVIEELYKIASHTVVLKIRIIKKRFYSKNMIKKFPWIS